MTTKDRVMALLFVGLVAIVFTAREVTQSQIADEARETALRQSNRHAAGSEDCLKKFRINRAAAKTRDDREVAEAVLDYCQDLNEWSNQEPPRGPVPLPRLTPSQPALRSSR
jgi:hypothetical protein